jgi:hypothetical protein
MTGCFCCSSGFLVYGIQSLLVHVRQCHRSRIAIDESHQIPSHGSSDCQEASVCSVVTFEAENTATEQ